MGLGSVGAVVCRGGERFWRRECRCMKASGWGAAITKGPMNGILMISRSSGGPVGLGRRYNSNAALGRRYNSNAALGRRYNSNAALGRR